MLTISKPLSAAQAHRYHEQEFRNARENYYTSEAEIRGTWHGQLAASWGLRGDVEEGHFQRLAEGQDPHTSAQLIRHRAACTYTNARGQTVTTMAHRAGWDATFSAPKSVSLTALVGGDARVRDAHRKSVAVALDQLEQYVQARLGDHPAETTRRWVAAQFEHDSARPVDGYAAPQLHTHVVVFNLTRTEAGDMRPLQPRELYKSQQFATAVYRAELATRVMALGYEIDHGAHSQPEIRGYTAEYLEASSPRRRQIQEQLAQAGRHGAEAAEIAAHQTREAKPECSHEQMQQKHQALAHAFGDQPAQVVQAAQTRAPRLEQEPPGLTVRTAITYAKDRNLEREAVVDERALLRDALTRGMGALSFEAVKTAFEQRVATGEFVHVHVHEASGAAGRTFTTREMIALEREIVERMRQGQQRQAAFSLAHASDLARDYPHLSEGQHAGVAQILGSRDQVVGLEGVAGAGKTTTLSAIREEAERAGYRVEGFAPTSRAAQQLGESGIATMTLQRHVLTGHDTAEQQKHLFVLDESSLASTTQLHAFLHRLGAADRVLLVGDVRQHQAVEAGRPYQQLQEAGMQTAHLDVIVRQRDPALRAVVEHLSRGEVSQAVHQLNAQGRVHEIPETERRMDAVARQYVRDPLGTLVVSPDNASRTELNRVIHRAMQEEGQVNRHEHHVRVLVPRQDVTGADRQWAARYEPGDVVRYTVGSRALGLGAGEYARVAHVNTDANQVTVRRPYGARITYDPRRLQGVTLYREADRALAAGDRVQITAPNRERQIANRELGTIEQIDSNRDVHVRLDSGPTVVISAKTHVHLDYGYAVTSHASQGQTADRVLVHVDTAHAAEQLLNRRLAYVAISRGRYDVQIYTNDKVQLAVALQREVSHRVALETSRTPASPAQTIERASERKAQHKIGVGR